MAKDVKKIKILPEGPYEVTSSVPLNQMDIVPDRNGESKEWKQVKEYPACEEETYHLCRCGHSKNKPYCDGAHKEMHFKGKETASRKPFDEQAQRYPGDTVDMLDAEDLCAGARFCDRGENAWVYAVNSAQPGFEELAIHECGCCPSGRLVLERKNGERIEPELPQEISLVEDIASGHRGPLWVKGGIPVEGADGVTYEVRNRVTLCRCGKSSNLPYCDGSHQMCDHMKGHDE